MAERHNDYPPSLLLLVVVMVLFYGICFYAAVHKNEDLQYQVPADAPILPTGIYENLDITKMEELIKKYYISVYIIKEHELKS